MKKSEMIASVAKAISISQSTVSKVLNACLEQTSAALAEGEEVRLMGFGTFSQYTTTPRKSYNPQTGETFMSTGRKKVRFTAGSGLKKAIEE